MLSFPPGFLTSFSRHRITAMSTRLSRGTGQSQPKYGSPTSTVLCILHDTYRHGQTTTRTRSGNGDRAVQCPIRRSRCEPWDGLGPGGQGRSATNSTSEFCRRTGHAVIPMLRVYTRCDCREIPSPLLHCNQTIFRPWDHGPSI